MQDDFTKSDRRKIRSLAGIAWERQLRAELIKIGKSIDSMIEGKTTPFDVNDVIHKFHTGVSRDLYNQFSESLPWFAVCRAHIDGVLTDDDLTDASDRIVQGIQKFTEAIT